MAQEVSASRCQWGRRIDRARGPHVQKGAQGGKDPRKPAGDKIFSCTQANASYGPHERNKLDFWRAESDRATPVLVYFHGGSFKAGDKANVLTRPILAECLAAGISVVSANYRFSSDAPFPAPMHDGAARSSSSAPRRRSGTLILRGLPSVALQPERLWPCGSRCTMIWPIPPVPTPSLGVRRASGAQVHIVALPVWNQRISRSTRA